MAFLYKMLRKGRFGDAAKPLGAAVAGLAALTLATEMPVGDYSASAQDEAWDRFVQIQGPVRPRTPETGLTNANKMRTAEIMMNEFNGFIDQVPRWRSARTGRYRNQSWTIIADPGDPSAAAKEAGIDRGMRLMIDRGIILPSSLRFYLHNGADLSAQQPNLQRPLTIAYQRGNNWAPLASVILTSIAPVPNTSPDYFDRVSSSNFNGLDKATITPIHEVGHILHERHAGEFFWTSLRTPMPRGSRALEISAYAVGRKKEFAAEVFAAAIIGMPVPAESWAAYRAVRGPIIPGMLGSYTYQ